jgi:hypothetical protein
MKSKVIKIQGITGEMPLIAISGLPGLGAVGINAASLFVSEGSSVLISQILIKSSSSNLIVSENGVVSPSAFNVYYVTSKDFLKPILVLLGSFQSQNAVEQYKLAETFLNLAKKLRIRYVFSSIFFSGAGKEMSSTGKEITIGLLLGIILTPVRRKICIRQEHKNAILILIESIHNSLLSSKLSCFFTCRIIFFD